MGNESSQNILNLCANTWDELPSLSQDLEVDFEHVQLHPSKD